MHHLDLSGLNVELRERPVPIHHVRDLHHVKVRKQSFQCIDGFDIFHRLIGRARQSPVLSLNVHLDVSKINLHLRQFRPQPIQELIYEDEAILARGEVGEEVQRMLGVVVRCTRSSRFDIKWHRIRCSACWMVPFGSRLLVATAKSQLRNPPPPNGGPR